MASSLKGITIKIGADTSELTTALSGVNKNARSLQSELRQVEKLLKMDPGNTDLLRQKQEILSESIENTKNKLEQLRDAEKQVKEQFERGEIGEEQYRALEREIVATEQKLESLEAEAKEFGSVSAQVAKATGEKFKEVGDKISGAGKTLTAGVTAPIVGLGALAVKTAADFDSSMSQVQATMGIASDATSKLNGETVNTMSSLRELAKEMGASTAFSASECADAMNYLALAGYNTQEIYDTLPTVLNLAAAGGIDLASASDMVTDAMSALGMETSEADKMVDQMAKTASSTNTSVAQLGEAILTIGATAKSIKGGTAELNTALGILANNGIKGAEGGTHLRNVILSLQNPTDAAYVAMTELGVAVYDAEGDMRSLNDILGDLNTSMDGMTSEEKSNIISNIFNKTDLASVQALLASTGETWDALQESITGSAGSAQQMADTQLDNLAGQLTILKSSLEGLAISFGELLMPYIQQVVEKVQSAVEWFNGLDEGTKKLILTIAGIAAVVGPVLVVVGSVMSAIGTILTMVPAIVSGITAVGTALTAAMGPIGWVALGIAGLITFLITLWNTNEDFRNGVIAIWEAIKNFFVTTASAIAATFIGAWEAIKAVWNGVASFFTTVVTGIQTAFSNIKQFFLKVGENIINGIKEGLLGGIGKLKEAAETVINKVKGFFTGKQGFDEHSPSKWGFEVGRYVGLGVALGIEQEATKAEQAAQTLASKVFSATSKAFQRQIKFQNMSLAEQIEGWQLIQAQFIEGSEQYLQVEETIFDLRAQQRKEDEQKTREYYTQIEKLIGDAQKTQEEYTSKLKNRTQEIFSSYGLFDEVAKKERVSGNVLLKNLKDQVSSLDGFYSKLDELEARGVGADLVDEIRKMGPDAAANLDALLSMSDERLAEYADLYREKQQLANRVALEELSGLKSDTAEAIRENLEEIDKIYKENAPLLGETLGEGISEGLKATLSELQSFSAPLGGISVLSAGTEVRLADALSSLGSGASYAVAPQATETTPARRDDAKEFVGMMSDAVASAVAAGLQSIADTMFAAMPDDVVLKIGDKQIARAVWSAFESEANRRNRMFAPSREQIMRIAKAAGGA